LPAAAGSLVAQFLAATAAAAKATWARREFAARFPPRKEVKAIVRLFSGTQMQGVASEPAWIIAGWGGAGKQWARYQGSGYLRTVAAG